jgi:hypothetical protein
VIGGTVSKMVDAGHVEGGVHMPDQDAIDGLVATYLQLNTTVRLLPEERLSLRGEGGPVREVVTRLRDRELRFSEALRSG